MKITNARVIVCSPGRNFVTLKIETDEGLHGIGDATLNGRELAVVSYLTDHVIPCLIGRDPQQIEDIWQYHRHYLHRRERAVVGFVALVHFRCRPISQMVMPPRLWSTETHLGRLGGH